MKTESIRHARAVVNLYPDLPEALLNLGVHLYWHNEIDSAEAQFFNALKLRPFDPEPYKLIGLIYRKRGKYADAIQMYRKAQQLYREIGDEKGAAHLYRSIGSDYQKMKDFDKAIANYDSAYAFYDELYEDSKIRTSMKGLIHRFKFNIYWKISDYTQAAEQLRQVITAWKVRLQDIQKPTSLQDYQYPNFKMLWGYNFSLGKTYIYLGQYTEALAQFDSTLAFFPKSDPWWFDLNKWVLIWKMLVCRILGDYDQAFRILRNLADFLSTDEQGVVLTLMGRTYQAMGMLDSARFYLTEASKVNPDYALWSWGVLLYQQDEYAASEDSLRKYLQLPGTDHQDSLHCQTYLSAIAVKQDQVEKGLSQIKTTCDSLKIHSHIIEAHRVMGELLIDLGRKDEAKQHLEEGRKMAEKSGMKGELKKYDELLGRLKEI